MTFVRANFSAALATCVTWLVALALTRLGVHYLAASAVGALAGAITDFTMKRYWAFERDGKATLARESVRYVLVSAASLGWNLLVAFLLVDGLGAGPMRGVMISSVIVGLAWNYPMHRFVVFREMTDELDEDDDAELVAD